MFAPNQQVWLHFNVNGTPVNVAGITTSQEWTVNRLNRNTGRTSPTQYVEVLSYHDVPASMSRSGKARNFYKVSPQATTFMSPRAESVKGLDDLTDEQLWAAVAKSAKELQEQTATTAPAGMTRNLASTPRGERVNA